MKTSNSTFVPRLSFSVNPDNLSVSELDVFERVAPVLDFRVDRVSGIRIYTEENSAKELNVSYVSSKDVAGEAAISISYPDIRGFARALSHIREVYESKRTIQEKPNFEDLGFMLDASRNAVPTVESVKLLLNTIASMGFNVLLLYLEDTYAIEGYPYFGYQRGSYSPEELREMDDYAFALGIELIPCIQTLAHLETTLRWPYGRAMKDTDDILLVGDEKTYDFIAAMLKALSKNVRSRRIHLGMDEAFCLGRGTYLDKNEFEPRYRIFQKHLARVMDLCRAENYKPMIWSDMYFRFASARHDYYDTTTPLTDEIKNSIPDDLSLVYWDYYHDGDQFYQDMLKRHMEINTSEPWFAGGIWTWNGIKVNHGKMFKTTEAALKACVESGTKHVLATAWGDNGAETSIFEALLGLQYFAEMSWNETSPSRERALLRYKLTLGADGEAFYNMRLFDEVPAVSQDNMSSVNPSKYILYSDPLSGLFDAHILPKARELSDHYLRLAEYFDVKSNETQDQNRLFYLQSAQLADVLQRKVLLTYNLRSSYLQDDEESLRQIVDYELPELIAALSDLQAFTMSIWYLYNKPQGSEIIDARFGAQIARLKTCLDRLDGYLHGVYEKLPELEQVRLAFDGRTLAEVEMDPHISVNLYHEIISANLL